MSGLSTIIEKHHSRDLSAATDPRPQTDFLKHLLAQTKQLSQLIAFIWRWIDEDVNQYPKQVKAAKSLHQYFIDPSATGLNPLDESLKKLFGADPQRWLDASEQERTNLPDKKEAELLVTVFGEDRIKSGVFPIFSEFEQSSYLIKVDFNAFQGNIADPNQNTPGVLCFTVPYPPAPKYTESTVTLQELEDWINNTEEKQIASKNPYIPTTCS